MTADREMAAIEAAPLRKAHFWHPEVTAERRRDGTVIVRQTGELPPFPLRMTDRLAHYAAATPDAIFLADRDDGGAWRTVTYAEAHVRIRSIGNGLIDFGLSADRPLLILSGNDIEHALLGLAAQYIGVPYSPISPAYSKASTSFARLREIVDLLRPGLIFAADGEAFMEAIAAVAPSEIPIVTVRNPVFGRRNVAFDRLESATGVDAADRAHRNVGPDTIAKFLFTSGSTGTPKAVINTQRMMTANQEMVRDCFAYMRDEPPVVLDWAPWNHTAGGNKVFNMVLYNGGTLYIDDGRPTADGIGRTVRNLRDVAPTWYFNVPRGFEELVPHLERDNDLRDRFFSRLSMMMYAGAGLGQHTWTALERLAVQATGERVLLVTGLGSTETAPFSMMCTVDQRIAGNIGVPAKGVTLKLVPMDGKFEARLKGPNVTPGYWRDPERTAEAFDDEGFYRLGDAFRFADPDDAAKGFYFDGRVAENFKLTTGTWVNAGALRTRLIDALGGLARDAAITGLDRDFVGALVIPDLDVCRKVAGADRGEGDAAVLASAGVRSAFGDKLSALGRTSTGSSTFIRRILLLAEPPLIDRGELTDKGTLNPRAFIANRAALVEELYAGSPRVISAD